MPTFNDTAEFSDVTCDVETALAIHVNINGQRLWIPQKQIDDRSEVWKRGDRGTLVISQWIAEQKGLV